MGYGELVGMKNKFGYSSYLLHIFTKDSTYYGQTVTVLDEDGNTLLTGDLSATGVLDLPTTYKGTMTFQVGGENLATCKTVYYGTYNVEIKSTIIYTFKISASDTNPASRVTYQDDCAGYTSAYMDFVNGVFEQGSWKLTDSVKEFFMPKPAMCTYAGDIDYYLDEDDYSLKEDGITASDVNNSSYGGNAMMIFPHTWVYRRADSDGGYLFSIANKQVDANYTDLHCHTLDGQSAEWFGWSIYEGSKLSSVMRALSGQTPYNNEATSAEMTYIAANGGDQWSHYLVAHLLYLQDLMILIGASTNTQEVFGAGVSNAAAAISTGTMDTKGLFWGDTSGTAGVKVLGIENPWGNVRPRIPSWINASGTQKLKLTYGTEDGSSTTGWNTSGSGYVSLTSATPAGTSGGYISKCKIESFGRVPYYAAGSSTTYECDGLWFANSQTNVAYVGGNWGDTSFCGAFCVVLYATASCASAGIGSGLSLTQPTV